MIVDVFTEVYTTLKTALTSATVLSAYPETTPVFPCVIVEETANTTDPESINTSGEQYNDITFTIDIFSNSETKFAETRQLRKSIDDIMSGSYRMTRTFSSNVPNFIDMNVNRHTLRYSFKINSSKQIHRG